MKILGGGEWTRGDAIAIVGLVFAIVGTVAAVLAIPGMPKIMHYDSGADDQSTRTAVPATTPVAIRPLTRPVAKSKDVTSSQVNFGCDQTLPVETPVVSFGLNPREIQTQPSWTNTSNVKTQNQTTVNVSDAGGHVVGVKAAGSVTGLDSQEFAGIKNCPGGGHGELTLHVSWTEDQPAALH